MTFTIEQREINAPGTSVVESIALVVDAPDCEHALYNFVSDCDCELLSYVSPAACTESIATVRQGDALFMLRIYPN